MRGMGGCILRRIAARGAGGNAKPAYAEGYGAAGGERKSEAGGQKSEVGIGGQRSCLDKGVPKRSLGTRDWE
jgi:hypothetical protein